MKRILASLALLAALSPAACGGDDDGAGVDVEGPYAKDASGRAVKDGEWSLLFTASNLSRALGDIHAFGVHDEATVDLRIEPTSLKTRAQNPGQVARSLRIRVSDVETDGSYLSSADTTPHPGEQVTGPPLSAIDAGAVERIARQVAEEGGVDLLGIDYITTLVRTKPFRWGIYLEDGRRWEANLDGTGVMPVP